MKPITTTIALFLVVTLAYGQASEKRYTQAEEFSLKSGTLIRKEFIDVGTIKGIEVQVLKVSDLHSGNGISALRLNRSVQGRYTSASHTAALDADELDDLMRAINNLKMNVFPTSPYTYTEVTFQSKAGFEAGAYYDQDRMKWVAYLRLEKYDRDSMVFLSVSDFDELLTLIGEAKQKM